MTAPDILAGRLRLLADRLYADGTFGGKIVAEELLEAADLLVLAPSAPDEVDGGQA